MRDKSRITGVFRSKGQVAFAVAGATIALSASLAGVATAGTARAATPIKLVLGWIPDAESGGWYAAQAEGLYAKAGLSVSLVPGGPQVSATQLVASGRAQFGITDAEGVIQAREDGIPLVAIAAMYQTNPVGVMVHKSQPWTSWKDLSGKTWVVQTGELGQQWVADHEHLKVSTIAYQGSIADFLHNSNLVQQGWPTNEAYTAATNGVKVRFFSYASAGYNPYNDVVVTTESYLKAHPNIAKDLLTAGLTGWKEYMGSLSVAAKTNSYLVKVNSQDPSAAEWYAWAGQRQFITAGASSIEGIGSMTLDRWKEIVNQMAYLKAIKSKPVASSLFTNAVNPRILPTATMPSAPVGAYKVPTGSYVVAGA